jgi:3-deoxy-D-manno-octulosonic-acid transferase
VFILTKTDFNADIKGIEDELKRINPGAEIFESAHKPLGFYKLGESRNLFERDIFKGKTAAVFSGIASPLYFEHTLKNLGVNIGLTFRFPDHHPYSQKDLSDIAQESARQNIAAVVTTEKDAARLTPGALKPLAAPVFVLRVRLTIIKDEERFYYRLCKLYSL